MLQVQAGARAQGRALCALFIFPLIAALLAPSVSAAPAPPSCEVWLDEHAQLAHPTTTTTSTLTFAGHINVTLGSVSGSRSMLIEVQVSPAEWAGSIDPTSENVSGTERVNFTATLVVPAGELATTRGSVLVSASFQVFPGAPSSTVTCGDQANVAVAQYHGVDADAITPRIETVPGPNGVVGTVLVFNSGNGRDTFSITLENAVEAQAAGVLTNLPLRVTVEPGAQTNVSFTINATSDTDPANYDLFVVVKSDAEPSAARDEVTITVVVKPGGIIQVNQDPTTVLLGVGVIGALFGIVAIRRASKSRKAAREARRQLQKIMKTRREQGIAEPTQGGAGGPLAQGPSSPPKPSR